MPWRFVGIGDLDGDGRDDVLLRHRDGYWFYYPMNGRHPVRAWQGFAALTKNTAWHFAGIGDFNGDGKDDVLLRHDDGRWFYYGMEGRYPIPGQRGFANLTPNRAWKLAGIGDLNGDGRDDVLLRHDDGRWFYYPMNGRQPIAAERGLANMTRNLNWRFAGIGDLNGDGRDDVLLRHTNGQWFYYPMSGRYHRAGQGFAGMTSNVEWRFRGIGDLNGDRRDDVLLRHTDGRWFYYPMDGRQAIASERGTADLTRNSRWTVPTVGRADVDPGPTPQDSPYIRTRRVPTSEIEAGWRDGRYITYMGYAEGYWSVVMSVPETSRIEEQRLLSGSSLPRDDIRDAWNLGFDITEVAYGNGLWQVVMSKAVGFRQQSWNFSSSFPDDQIRDWKREERYITDLVYGGGGWLAVAAEVDTYSNQVYQLFANLNELMTFVDDYWGREYRLTEVAFGDGVWVAIMTLTGHRWPQRWQARDTFPAADVEENLKEGLRFLDLAYGDGTYLLASSSGIDNVLGFSPPSLPSGGALDSSVTDYTATSANFVIDLFAVDSASNLLELEASDLTIDGFEFGGGAQVHFTQTDVDLVDQSYIGPYSATFLFDQSGSITGTDPSDIRIEAARVFLANLGSGDEVGLLAFASGGSLPRSPVTAYQDETTGNAFTRECARLRWRAQRARPIGKAA